MEHEANKAYARRNEDMLRGANKAVEREAQIAGDGDHAAQHPLLCECAEACGATINISFAEWDDVHRDENRFTVAHGHEDPAVEQVVNRNDRFLAVEKSPVALTGD